MWNTAQSRKTVNDLVLSVGYVKLGLSVWSCLEKGIGN